jgi:hypothetical protein
MPDPEVLLQRYVEDRLSHEDASAMMELLARDPTWITHITAQLHMDAMLRETSKISCRSPDLQTKIPRRYSPWKNPLTRLAVAASIALAFILVYQSDEEAELTTNAVAVLMSEVNAKWSGFSPKQGMPLAPNVLNLTHGLAQIEFYQGARVTLEGPARFELISTNSARCTQGKLSAHVPAQAKGFRIETPKGTIVDLGTDFGLDMNMPSPEIHVFKGEVQLHRESTAILPIKGGEALALSHPSAKSSADHFAFESLASLDQRTAESQRMAFQNWLASTSHWKADSSMIMHLDFQDAKHTRSLRNQIMQAESIPDASIVGCQWTQGRWPGKQALEFRNVSDRVRLSIPGEYSALTLCAWVRVDSLDRVFNSLFMVQGYENGGVHWQITRDGQLRLGLASRSGAPAHDYDAPAIITPDRFGSWIHLATVIDPQSREVRHYLNGELVARLPRLHTFQLQMPLAELGNWNNGGRVGSSAIRHFSGLMDEFMLFARALSDRELEQCAQ